MATRLNTAYRDLINDAQNSIFDVMEIRSGLQPTSANDVASGTLLAEITIPATHFLASAAGTMAKTGTWSATAGASGIAGWARLRNTADTLRRDIAISENPPNTGDGIIDDENIVSGGTVTVTTFNIVQPSGEA